MLESISMFAMSNTVFRYYSVFWKDQVWQTICFVNRYFLVPQEVDTAVFYELREENFALFENCISGVDSSLFTLIFWVYFWFYFNTLVIMLSFEFYFILTLAILKNK